MPDPLIITTPGDRQIVITRAFAAPRDHLHDPRVAQRNGDARRAFGPVMARLPGVRERGDGLRRGHGRSPDRRDGAT